jgi:hypothetical protein
MRTSAFPRRSPTRFRALLASDPPVHGIAGLASPITLGRWIRTTDFYPDYQTRLYDRRHARWTGRYVHESVAVEVRQDA